jgi:methionine-gamma-lyase
LGSIKKDTPEYAIYKKQYTSAGAMLSFDIHGGEKEAFAFLNNLKMIQLAVSLGSTESLAEHPASMTHAGIEEVHRIEMGITDSLIRLSIGVENFNDIIWDIEQALDMVQISDNSYKMRDLKLSI